MWEQYRRRWLMWQALFLGVTGVVWVVTGNWVQAVVLMAMLQVALVAGSWYGIRIRRRLDTSPLARKAR